jgi:hypothetical protein
MEAPFFDGSFPHHWQAEILPTRPLILPTRHYTYPRDAEEVERGALEVLIRPGADPNNASNPKRSPSAQEFLATCALGFRDPAVPTGLWSAPNPNEICAVSGGYAYIIDTQSPEHFTMIHYRPILEVRPLLEHGLLLFVSHHSILAWGRNGLAWESKKLSSEGIIIASIHDGELNGLVWDMFTDKETAFALDLRTGARIS